MEALFIFIAKSSGLLLMFYCAYFFLLRKETFFNNNRWFLLTGLITSIILPFLVYTKNIWIDPTPMPNFDLSKFAVNESVPEPTFEINWNYIFLAIYGIGLLIFIIKFAMDFYSLNSVLKGKKVHQQADFKFIDTPENIAPFSYFDYIVYNSSMYTASELESIIEHEKVHSEQNHTLDVLISRAFCILFWFNPIAWLYKKAITQNLEFIADKEAAQKITDKKAYQYTLLKITTHENCVAITNHFYQSLIKKRIVMLNQNQSKKRNSWKFCVIIPALVAFVVLFQVEVVAHEKPAIETSKKDPKSVDVYKITKTTTDEELKKNTKTLKDTYDITATFSDLERNSKNELIAIKVELKKGSEILQKMEVKGTDAIKVFGIIITTLEDGKIVADFKTEEMGYRVMPKINEVLNDPTLQGEREIIINGEKATEEELAKLDPNEIEKVDVIKKSGKKTLLITKRVNKTVKITDKDIYINGVKTDEKELSKLDPETIDKMDVNKNEKTIRITTKTTSNTNGNIETKTNTQVTTIVNQQDKPLIVIDGERANSNVEVSDLQSDKIESMNVLKGKIAQDKYGSDGKNGVIEIITKDSKDGKSSITINEKKDNHYSSLVYSTGTNTKIKKFTKTTQLVIIDGKVLMDKNLDLEALDIEKMEVLKGLDAVAKYGDKGKDGVIIITTRK